MPSGRDAARSAVLQAVCSPSVRRASRRLQQGRGEQSALVLGTTPREVGPTASHEATPRQQQRCGRSRCGRRRRVVGAGESQVARPRLALAATSRPALRMALTALSSVRARSRYSTLLSRKTSYTKSPQKSSIQGRSSWLATSMASASRDARSFCAEIPLCERSRDLAWPNWSGRTLVARMTNLRGVAVPRSGPGAPTSASRQNEHEGCGSDARRSRGVRPRSSFARPLDCRRHGACVEWHLLTVTCPCRWLECHRSMRSV